MLTGLFWNFWSFLILFSIIHFGCWFEYLKLTKLISADNYIKYWPLGLLYITLPILMLIYLGLDSIRFTNNTGFNYSWVLPCTIIFSIWINDTMAYLVGSLIGKTPLTKISPKKTWEGTLGGIILSIVVVGFFFSNINAGKTIYRFNNDFSNYHFYVIAALCAIFGTFGDLLESKLKRLANVKDSGNFMPGHGGFLDRFDSLLLAVPAVWIYVVLSF